MNNIFCKDTSFFKKIAIFLKKKDLRFNLFIKKNTTFAKKIP